MKAVIQRVKNTTLKVDGELISQIDFGLAVYLGVTHTDTTKQADEMAKKIAHMRIFEDEQGKMNLDILTKKGQILLISQFTLYADTSHGNRPSFIGAARPEVAQPLYEYTAQKLREWGIEVKTGVFGADMKIEQYNDGPVTIIHEVL